MRRILRFVWTALVLLSGWVAPSLTGAANLDTTAHRGFGQPAFNTNAPDKGGLHADNLYFPKRVALDVRGNLYVAGAGHNRMLEHYVPLLNGVPVLTDRSPSRVALGSPAFTLTVDGSGFYATSVVRFNGSDRVTTFLSSTQLNAAISAADVITGGPFPITVFTPAPGGGTSTSVNLNTYTRAGQDALADMEQGQPNFVSNAANNALMPGGANRLNQPEGAAVDKLTGRLYVADSSNNRVLSWPNAAAEANGQAADMVLGQPDFSSLGANTNGRSASSLNFPTQLALDAQGNLYVADFDNNRVLEYSAPLTSGMDASRVFGQHGSFTSGLNNNLGISANSLYSPRGLAVDRQGNLYVADAFNSRVLEYNTPLSADTTADQVFGQPDLTHNTPNNGSLNASGLDLPGGVALDAQGNLYVADTNNNRVLEYAAPLVSSMAASKVLGQGGSFTTNTSNKTGINASGLYRPGDVALDSGGNLYVADFDNNRVLVYNAPLTSGLDASRVFGQPDFISNSGGLDRASLAGPIAVAVDAGTNLYVVDYANDRVLEYDWALAKLYLPLVRR